MYLKLIIISEISHLRKLSVDPSLRLTQDLKSILNIGAALKPVQLAVEAVCRRNCLKLSKIE